MMSLQQIQLANLQPTALCGTGNVRIAGLCPSQFPGHDTERHAGRLRRARKS
jgi:hypothetical protein